ncbi:MAG: formate--tetrahydrofolate ligase, partial [Alphaproteobacteria bacterium]
ENVEAVKKGCANLARHIENVKKFGVPPVVAINRFLNDTEAELEAVRSTAEGLGARAIICSHWADGGAGTEELARHVVDLVESGSADFKPLYDDAMPLWDKVETIARELYGAAGISADDSVRKRFDELQAGGYGHFPVCMAKTQYSFSTDPNLKGAPSGHIVPVREVRVSGGAEFLVVITGAIMTMPGLPRVPAANSIHLNEQGQIEGLF